MLLNGLYNAVDRIFVSRGVGELALTGLSIVLPLMTVSMAFAMLFGVGCANMISMRLGQQRRNDAENALQHGFWLLLISSIVLALIEFPLIDWLLVLLGAQPGSDAMDYARSYYRIILAGQPFMMVGFGLSHSTRAQGFPVVSMVGMFIGAGLNMILDPIFIYGLRWGVEGAAIATIISQAASAFWMLTFCLGKRAVIRLRPFAIKADWRVAFAVMNFGCSQFLLQFAMSSVQFLINSSMQWYGAAALGVMDGGDIALASMNIIGTFNMIFLMPIFGINQGAQPVLGFNYGARKFARVRKAYLGAVSAATLICIAGFIWAEFFPESIVMIFAPRGSETLLSFTPRAFRIAEPLIFLAGFQIVSTNMFVVTGRPKVSIVLSLMRQCIAIVPAILIFGKIWGLLGVVAAMPFADAVSTILTAFMIVREMKKLKRGAAEQAAV
jgi:putative MATE family efflux protein